MPNVIIHRILFPIAKESLAIGLRRKLMSFQIFEKTVCAGIRALAFSCIGPNIKDFTLVKVLNIVVSRFSSFLAID